MRCEQYTGLEHIGFTSDILRLNTSSKATGLHAVFKNTHFTFLSDFKNGFLRFFQLSYNTSLWFILNFFNHFLVIMRFCCYG